VGGFIGLFCKIICCPILAKLSSIKTLLGHKGDFVVRTGRTT
jgi:hypothetical protein